MAIRNDICAEALTWRGTPWRHRSCVKGPHGGVDCVRLAEGVSKALGLLDTGWEVPFYTAQWHLHQNEEMLRGILDTLGLSARLPRERQPGDLLGFQYGRVMSHLAILVSPSHVVHAVRDEGRVVHQSLAGDLFTRLRVCYAFPGVEVPV